MNPITKLTQLGQSIWYDNIQRKLLENGELKAMIVRGDIRGVTSNPSIFNAAIVRTGIFSGNPPTPEMEKKWGTGRGVVHVFLQARAANVDVTVTPTVYIQNGSVTGTAQTITALSSQTTKAAVYLPDAMGWGFSLDFLATTSSGRWRLLGYAGSYEEVTDA